MKGYFPSSLKMINATLLNFCTFVKKFSTPTFFATGYLAYGI